uniref:MACPF domain-containing protein n=1 Tax=Aegilops tauschii subsp. strangulata TaxID=200361 RepID=A0A453GTI2_AEGTS
MEALLPRLHNASGVRGCLHRHRSTARSDQPGLQEDTVPPALHFSKVVNAYPVRQPEWEGSPNLIQKSGLISTLISTHFSTAVQPPKLLKFVDRTEMARGPHDLPGYWVVSAAKLHLERGKISLRVRYSLVTSLLPGDEEYALNEEF